MSRVLKQLFQEKTEEVANGRPDLRVVPPPPPVIFDGKKKISRVRLALMGLFFVASAYLGVRVVQLKLRAVQIAVKAEKPLVPGIGAEKVAEPADLRVSRSAIHSFELQDYNGALESLESLAKNYPHSAEILNNLGMVHFKLKEYPVAKKIFIEALHLENTPQTVLATIYNNLGSLSLALHQYDEAVSYLQKSLILNPKLTEGHFNLAVALENINEPAEAAQEYEIYEASARIDPLVKEKLSARISKLKTYSTTEE